MGQDGSDIDLPTVSVRSTIGGLAGAVGDFANADDRLAIQRAIDKAAALALAAGSQAVVWLDPGTYGFSIDTTISNPKRAFTAKPGVIITGPGKLKLRNSQGNYGTIFGNTAGTDVSGFELQGVTIDLNATNNAVPTSADMTVGDVNESRCILQCSRGDRVRVRGCRFIDCGDFVNGIVVNGDNTSAEDFECVGNLFENIGQASFAHDCSVIYWDGKRCNVSRNVIRARSAGLGGCTAAIELHGPGQVCEGNRVENFLLGGYALTNRLGGDVAIWRGNVMVGVTAGIFLIPYDVGGLYTGTYGLTDTLVEDNDITLDRDQWYSRTDLVGSQGYAVGIAVKEGSNKPVDGVEWRGNTVRYRASSQTSDSAVSYKDTAYRFERTVSVVDRGVRLVGNRSYGALSAGMIVNAKLLGAEIRGNEHFDPGSHVNLPGGAGSAYRAGTVFVGADPKAVVIGDNPVHDSRGAHVVIAQLYLAPTGSATDCSLLGAQPVFCADAASVRTVAAGGQAFYVVVRDKNSGLPSFPARFGSQVIDDSAGVLYRQTASPSGTTWTAEPIPGIPYTLDHSGTSGIVTALKTVAANALNAGSRWSMFTGPTETGRIEAELLGGTDAPLRLYAYTAAGLVECFEARQAADGETALLVRRNVGGTFSLQRVSMGAADSGGSGFKLLRVPN